MGDNDAGSLRAREPFLAPGEFNLECKGLRQSIVTKATMNQWRLYSLSQSQEGNEGNVGRVNVDLLRKSKEKINKENTKLQGVGEASKEEHCSVVLPDGFSWLEG